jgi:hypothetical protein
MMVEVWLRGSHAELDQAARKLAELGPVIQAGQRQRIEPGRYATYARIAVASRKEPADEPASL